MPWPDSVVGRLREQIAAMRAFWHTWQTGEALNFRGETYRLSLMTPFFNPGPIDHPQVPVYIAGVNPGLARLAGETAQGFHVHPLHTPRYLSEIVRPAIAAGAARAGRSPAEVAVSVSAFTVTAPEEDQFVRAQIAFYASTPSYRPVMALHGWEATARALTGLASRGRWAEMPALISDEILATFAIVASPAELPAALAARYQGLADRLGLYIPFTPGERVELWERFVELKGR
jgi:probable F420-dependent oxidoreductase